MPKSIFLTACLVPARTFDLMMSKDLAKRFLDSTDRGIIARETLEDLFSNSAISKDLDGKVSYDGGNPILSESASPSVASFVSTINLSPGLYSLLPWEPRPLLPSRISIT
ncbi:hypothetical protein TWF788_009151 [Orbilia oligospora]|nr:hypothetical protein TWF788_009151 [Orbilia oligospora]